MQKFDVIISGQRKGHRRKNPVSRALPRTFDNQTARVAQHIAVIAAQPGQRIRRPRPILQPVHPGIANDLLGKTIAGQVQSPARCIGIGRQNLDPGIGRQGIADRAVNPVISPLPGLLDHQIGAVGHLINIIPAQPLQRISGQIAGAATRAQHIGPGIADDPLTGAIAGQVNRCGPGGRCGLQHLDLHIGLKRKTDRRQHPVSTALH